MKIYKQDVINLTQQYISELINYNEEVNIRMFYSTFDEDQYISILNDQDQEVSFNPGRCRCRLPHRCRKPAIAKWKGPNAVFSIASTPFFTGYTTGGRNTRGGEKISGIRSLSADGVL